MAIKSLTSLSLLLFTITLLFSSSSAHNITRILSKHPKFSVFNSLLSSTNLAKKINHRHSITVLAVSNASIGGVIGLSPKIQRRILSVHVILDYFDREKLQNLKSHSTIVTTLFQTFGIAEGRTGFLNVTKFVDGRIAFGSAASGAHLVGKLVGPIAKRPYNISVLHISSIIIPPGIDGPHHNNTPPSPLPPAPTKADAKAPPPAAEAPVIEHVAPVVNAPEPKPAPTDAPVANTSKVESPKGAEDDKVKSSAGRVAIGAGFGAFMGVALIALQ
ncbi:hypothetical protein IEQ34_008485 [Dendrobium chrysotoxum]|uniref:FAS1 domain-containing protein n=1 Tax=Dendrobium chrysotoxum TaxID=161865 RepID=A0AAV7H086_DENCH|nr:hypothetical protein IEQ34_008485 [Dendrobium chrysotoxum]